MPLESVCRSHGIARGTLYNWRVKYGGMRIIYTQPGHPTQNSYIERFNGSYRRAVLDAYIFRNLDEVRETTEKWMSYYNTERPHDALEDMAPLQYREFLLSGLSKSANQ